MNHTSTIYDLLKEQTQQLPNRPAIFSLQKKPLNYQQLFMIVQRTIQFLNGHGIGANDPVAIVLPNGPEMAGVFLAVACCAAAAPLNPNYRSHEFEFYLSDLKAKTLITLKGWETPARETARKNGIKILEVEAISETAGDFTLSGVKEKLTGQTNQPRSEDVALILHTSGTTSRPKMVPLTQENLCISAENISRSLQLTQADRCLNIMPLFHIHGLCAALLASLFAGGSVICTPGFYAPEFFTWMDTFQPTWFTAVPTMHQSILAQSGLNSNPLESHSLRFIRSCSSPLPPQVMLKMENTFNVPVIEAYGMTEASHQISSNPLPPGRCKPGSVGLAAGPEVSIMAENEEEILPAESSGEVVIRGRNVTSGYILNQEANSRAFTSQGWFRTGDQGYLDQDGYLFLTNRIKEIINRGGEKISPREIDEVLLEHQAVAQAVTFAMPDAKLGETVAAAVVLKDPGLTEKELRLFASNKLADFKIPQKIIFLEEIPKGPTGKIQRIGLAEKLGLHNIVAPDKDREEGEKAAITAMQKYLVGLWRETLHLDAIGINHSFLELGGDSILAAKIISMIRDQTGLDMSLMEFFDAVILADQAKLLEDKLIQSQDLNRTEI